MLYCLMPKVKFIRHYKLEAPFDAKETLTEELKRDLALGRLSPSIHPDFDEYLSANFTDADFAEIDLIITSPINRAFQTAQGIAQHFHLNAPIMRNSNLREVVWDPELGPGRVKRFIAESGEYGIANVWQRFAELKQQIIDSRKANILCVTHSFLIQSLYVYFEKGKEDVKQVTEEDIQTSPQADYLKGFEVVI
jgi:hypothetical protein